MVTRPTFQHILESQVFEKIIIENAVADPGARAFWTKYFLTQVSSQPVRCAQCFFFKNKNLLTLCILSSQTKVEWIEFWTCMLSFLKVPQELILGEHHPKLTLFKRALGIYLSFHIYFYIYLSAEVKTKTTNETLIDIFHLRKWI